MCVCHTTRLQVKRMISLVSTFQKKNSYSFKKLVINVITKMRALSFVFMSKRIKR